MSSTALVKARDHIMRLQAATKRAREKTAEVMENVITSAETVGTSFAFGLWEGRITDSKQFELGGIPIPLLAGVSAHAFALLGVGRGMEDHLRAIGNGALASHLNGIGRRVGSQSKIKKSSVRGELNASDSRTSPIPRRGTGITEADLANMAAL